MICSQVGLRYLLLLTTLTPYAAASDHSFDALSERLEHAAEATTLDSPDSPTFHLKLSIEIVPQFGRPADKGTVELWWNSADENRTVYDLSQYHATFVHTPNGSFSTNDAEQPSYIVSHMLAQVVHPIVKRKNDPIYLLKSVKESFGKISMDCITLNDPSGKASDPPAITYCFDEKAHLRSTQVKSDEFDLRQTMGTFGAKNVPLTSQYTFSHSMVASAHIEALQSQKAPYPQASVTSDLVAVPKPIASLPSLTMKGRVLRRPDPIYPEDAKAKHISGSVLLQAIIGTDGKITHLSLIGSPDESLTKSAMKAVSNWVYEPYILNGVPTEVDTTITVNYELRS